MVEVVMGLEDAVQLGRAWLTTAESRYESLRGGARIKEMRMKRAATAEKNRMRREPASLRSRLEFHQDSYHDVAVSSSSCPQPDMDARVRQTRVEFVADPQS
jgi:hypothetical protein